MGNGATANGASLISDGANVTDPDNGAGQTQTVNMDFVQEVKIETSNFGADTAKGPTVITAVGQSGTNSSTAARTCTPGLTNSMRKIGLRSSRTSA